MKKKRAVPRLLISIAFLLCLLSCSTVQQQKVAMDTIPGLVLIKGVPFFPQETYQCGPASMAGVMDYLGVRVTPDEVAKEIFSPSARGTLTVDMILYPSSRGLSARQYSGGWPDLTERISEGSPLIVLVDYGFSLFQGNHFMVVVGYNGDGVVVNSGKVEFEFIGKERFLGIWEKTKFWTLLIEKQSAARKRKIKHGTKSTDKTD